MVDFYIHFDIEYRRLDLQCIKEEKDKQSAADITFVQIIN